MATTARLQGWWNRRREVVGPAVAVGASVAACAVLRPLRDEQAVRCGSGVVTGLFLATFAALVLVTVTTAFANRQFGRTRAVNATIIGGLAGVVLILAWVGIESDGASPAGAALVVSHGVLTVFTVAMAWQSVADRASASCRGHAVAAAAIGAGLGSILGPLTASVLVAAAGSRWLVPAAATLLGIATYSATCQRTGGVSRDPSLEGVRAGVTSGTDAAVRRVASLVAGWSVVSTIIYFVQLNIVGEQLTDPHARVQWFASLDLSANAVALLVQIGTARWTARGTGLPTVLAIGPVLAAGGFVAIWLWPDAVVLAVVTVICRAGGTALFRPARELLLASVLRPVGSPTRCAIDGVVYRAADAATAASIGVLSGGAPTVGVLAAFGATAAVALAVAGFSIGRIHDHQQHNSQYDIAPGVREDAGRQWIDPGMPGGARCLGAGLDQTDHSIDGRAAADRWPWHLADLRRRIRRARADP